MPLDRRTAFSLISRVDDLRQQSAWYLLCAPADRLNEVAGALHLEARLQQVGLMQIEDVPLASLPQRLRAINEPLVVLVTTGAGEALGRKLESARSILPTGKQIVVLITREGAEAVQAVAPHFASFIEFIEDYSEDEVPVLTNEEVSERLTSLQQQFSYSNEEVIRLAGAGKLPLDPEFGEWLVLLGRGDLVK